MKKSPQEIIRRTGGQGSTNGFDRNDVFNYTSLSATGRVIANGGANYLDGGDGTDLLDSTGANSTLFGGAGNDTLQASGGSSYLDGEEGNNTLIASGGNNELFAGSGNDILQATGGNNYLDAGDGADTLIAHGGGNTLYGGAGNDTLLAFGGNNTLDGGEGRDWYVFDQGFGINHITDSGTGGNAIQFNFSFANSGIVLGIGSLKLSFANGDELHIDGFDPEDPINSCSIDTFQFADRTLSLPELLALGGPDIIGTANDDVIQGTGLNEYIYALESNDTVYAGAGNDTVIGDAGNDYLDGGTGKDTLLGGIGDDKRFSILFRREAGVLKAANDSCYQPFFERSAA